ncbi:hypothetical protein ACFO1B_44970 [Dactylosporangium siamense]|uniref:Uncharacterized protein n=1 Tax=Dactylosporangium siamense TaxID=685454 RepID=A0A919PW96_9ACTN|nr:hypothetical protein [Dactylosporangium siamense]GIG51314.1 hypothetical protein Dsi01nite_093550 [Dactylosporangium siamense]
MKRLLLLAVVLLNAGACAPGSPDLPAEEPAHQVKFEVSGTGSANEDVRIEFSAGRGAATGTATAPGASPAWSTTVTSEAGVSTLLLGASAASSDLSFKLTCVISVDGVEVLWNRGPYSCSASFELRNLASAKAAAAAKSPSSPSLVTPSVPASAAAPPAGCRFVAAADLSDLVSRLARVAKPVQSTSGTETSCRYVIDAQSTSVLVEWAPGKQAEPLPGTPREPGVAEPAYFSDQGMFQQLQVQRKQGLCTITVQRGQLDLDARKLAVEVYALARPNLP